MHTTQSLTYVSLQETYSSTQPAVVFAPFGPANVLDEVHVDSVVEPAPVGPANVQDVVHVDSVVDT